MAQHTGTGASSAKLCTLVECLRSGTNPFCREALIQELRGSMYGLLDASSGDLSQQAEHYEQRMRQLQTNLQGQLTSLSLPETQQHLGALRLTISHLFVNVLQCKLLQGELVLHSSL